MTAAVPSPETSAIDSTEKAFWGSVQSPFICGPPFLLDAGLTDPFSFDILEALN